MNLHQLISASFVLSVLVVLQEVPSTAAQQAFEVPIELIGFPVIILGVRLSNFVKKFAYAINPQTYKSRSRRAIAADEELIDMQEAEKRLVAELGENVCVYTKVCLHYAAKSRKSQGKPNHQIDWSSIFSHYKSSPDKNKEFYLLSVFLGDIVASPRFCNQLAKRGRQCVD